ncbi:MAG TPA: EAL domain-containing protein [Sulfuricurvum sp.]|nr:EAL domain-containing protein [Sulfuricurvum sp.]
MTAPLLSFVTTRTHISKRWLSGIFVFLVGIVLSTSLIYYVEMMRMDKMHHKITDIAKSNANLLRTGIDHKLALTYLLSSMVQEDGTIHDFDSIGKNLITFYPNISEIALVENGVIKHVVPVSGNEKALGFNLFTDPEQKTEALLAQKTGKLTLAGPLHLVQGGMGVVGRLPIYTKEQKFRGFILIVIRFPEFLHTIPLENLKEEGYQYTLTRIHPISKKEQIIASTGDEKLNGPVQHSIDLPNVTWTLRIAPIDGWINPWLLAIEIAIALLFSTLLGYIAKQYTQLKSYRNTLELKIVERTAEVTQTKNQLRTLLNTIPDLIWLKDKNGVYLLCNPMFERFFGAKEGEIVGKTDYDFVDKEQADAFRNHDNLAMEANTPTMNEEWITFASDGHRALLETVKIPMINKHNDLLGILGISHDITRRHHQEERIHQLTKLYATLSQCNHAIVHSNTPNELFLKVCESIVVQGGMSMAWIGTIDQKAQRIYPIVSYGDDNHYLDGIELSTQADLPSGIGPTGVAAREDHPCWCQDFMNDSATALWHDRAAQRGWKSSAALPIHLYDDVVGVFTIYSQTLNAFDPSSQELIIEMAMELSYAMENFDRENKRKVSESKLIQTEKLLEEMSMAAHIGGWEINLKNEMGIWTKEAAKIYDMVPEETITLPLALSVYEGEWSEKIQTALNELIHQRKSCDLELKMTTFKGKQKWVRIIASPIIVEGEVNQMHGSIQDITTQKMAEEKVQWLAQYDALTGLPNRNLLNDRIQYAISIAHRSKEPIALLFLDLDHFKNINDSLGHTIGDDLLINVSNRMKPIIREEDTLSRQGGDEFIIVLPNTDSDGAAHVAQKIIDAVSQPYLIKEHELSVTPSIGIALYPIDGNNAEALYQSADIAMYHAKHDGRNCFRFVTPEIQARSARNLEIENALRHALQRNELEVYYQPQISVETGKLIGAEALLRWHHPTLGMVSPAEFISIAEESGQIVTIGEWVLRNALRQLKAWNTQGIEPFIMAVNLSAIQFHHPSLVSMVLTVLDELQLPAQYLELELTEGIAMENPLHAIEIMNELYEHGIRMSIDDFGTGYSSLNYLKQFRVYKLKIDQSFIRDIDKNAEDKTIVNTIINMANNLNMITIAEGVETAQQLEILREIGCDEIQGYYFSEPLPASAFEAYVRQSL